MPLRGRVGGSNLRWRVAFRMLSGACRIVKAGITMVLRARVVAWSRGSAMVTLVTQGFGPRSRLEECLDARAPASDALGMCPGDGSLSEEE
jgi:hypothetical protein